MSPYIKQLGISLVLKISDWWAYWILNLYGSYLVSKQGTASVIFQSINYNLAMIYYGIGSSA